MSINDFKAAFLGSGARPNRFRVRGAFPSGASGVLGTAAGAVAGAAGGAAALTAAGASNLLGGGGPARKLEFLCTGASLPESMLGQVDVFYRGRSIKLPGDRTFAPWTITVLNDIDFSIRNAFEQWMDQINSHIQNIGIANISQIKMDWTVEQLGLDDSILKVYNMVGCWPTNLAPIDLSFDSNDNVEFFTVELAIDYWTSNSTT